VKGGTRGVLIRLIRIVLPEWRWALAGTCLSLAALLANMALLALSSWFIASMAIAGSMHAVMEYTLPATGVRALALARAGCRYAERLVNHDATLRILSGLRIWFYGRIEPLAPARLGGFRSGDLLSRIRADVDTLEDFHVRGLVPAVVAVLAAAGIVAWLARHDWRLAVLDAAALSAAGVLFPLLLKRLASGPGREKVHLAADLRACVVEEVQAMAELAALGALEAHEGRIADTAATMDARQRRLASLQGAGDAGLIAASSLAVWGAALITAPLVAAGRLPRADMAMLTVFMLASFEAVMPLPAVIQRAGELAAAARRLFEIADMQPAVTDPPHPAPPLDASSSGPDGGAAPSGGGQPAAPILAGPLGLVIRGLRFRYCAGEPWVLDGLSLDAPPGARIAVAGPTGAGKSSLAAVLLRFWEYEGGTVSVVDRHAAARELRGLGGDEARRLFSVVPQHPHLFHMSIRENLLIAAPDARDDELFSAVETAQLSGLVSRLPEGLGTEVGETGKELSAGEVRRVAVARALLKDAPFLILDEPTEGLDDATAEALLAGVLDRCGGRTILIISHHPRDLARAETLVELPGPGRAGG
jgi:ATP-binding cassette, subfamily C, bacterial CydC